MSFHSPRLRTVVSSLEDASGLSGSRGQASRPILYPNHKTPRFRQYKPPAATQGISADQAVGCRTYRIDIGTFCAKDWEPLI